MISQIREGRSRPPWFPRAFVSSPESFCTVSTPSEDDDGRDITDILAEFATEIACPNCGDHALEFVRQVALEGEANENVETFTGGLGGAFAGGLGGAVFGPAGIIAGAPLGGSYGKDQAEKQELKRRMDVRCQNCGYHGRADGGPAESG